MIKATVEEEAPETQKYVKHVLAEFVRHAPLSKGKKIEIKVIENLPPFPEIAEETDYYQAGRLTIPDADYERERREVRTAAFIAYHTKRFKGLFSFLNPSEVVGNTLRGTLKFAVISPEKIYAECKKYGILIPSINEKVRVADPNAAEIAYGPTRILWKNQVINIEHDTVQEDVCKFAFQRSVNKSILLGEIEEHAKKFLWLDKEKGRTSIYNAVYDLNLKTKAVCGTPLFEWKKRSFRRLA